MNLVGKIFIVLIFVLSLMFMSFAVAVYATHQNWRAVVERTPQETPPGGQVGLKYQLQQARELNKQLKEQHEKLLAEVKAELEAKVVALTALELEFKDVTTKRDEAKAQLADLQKKESEAVAAMNSAQTNLDALTGEVGGLRKEIRDTQAERDKHFQAVVALTEQVNQAQGELNRLKERGTQLASDVAAQKKVLEANGLTKDTPVDGIPPAVRGKVLAINRDKMLEISLGSDDGLRVGHKLEIFRASKYLGRVEILSTTYDRAVARIVPGFQQGVIQKGDDVTTGFKVS